MIIYTNRVCLTNFISLGFMMCFPKVRIYELKLEWQLKSSAQEFDYEFASFPFSFWIHRSLVGVRYAYCEL